MSNKGKNVKLKKKKLEFFFFFLRKWGWILCTSNKLLNKDEKLILNENAENKIGTASLSMMYETELNSGKYDESSDNLWPEKGYIFNENLSKCEQGGTFTWNKEDISKRNDQI